MKNTTPWAVRALSRLLVMVMALAIGLGHVTPSQAQSADPIARGLAAKANTPAGISAATGALRDDLNVQGLAAVVSALKSGVNDNIVILGDSTNNDPDEWPTLLGQYIGALVPNANIRVKYFDDATTRYNTADSVIQVGGGEKSVRFGSGASSNGRYWPSAYVGAWTSDLDIRIKFSLDSFTPSTANALVSSWNFTDGKRSFLWILDSNGTMRFIWSPTGNNVDSITATSSAPGLTSGQTYWLRVVLQVNNGSGGNTTTFYKSAATDGVNWTMIGSPIVKTGTTSVSALQANTFVEVGSYGGQTGPGPTSGMAGNVYQLEIRDGVDGKILNPVSIDSTLEFAGSTSEQGAATLTIWNGAIPGANYAYFMSDTRFYKIVPNAQPAMVFFSSSLNELGSLGETWTGTLDSALTKVKARVPLGSFAFITQNITKSPYAFPVSHTKRVHQLLHWCLRNGVECINTYLAFVRDGRGDALIANDGLGVHPGTLGKVVESNAVNLRANRP